MSDSTPQKGTRFREIQPFVLVVLAFALGILADWLGNDSALETFLSATVIAWGVGLISALVLWRILLTRQTLVASGCLLLGIAAAGGLWHHLYWNVYPKAEISFTFRKDTTLAMVEGVVARPLERFYASDDMLQFQNQDEITTTLELQVQKMKDRQTWIKTPGRVAVRIQGNVTEVHPGDTVQISGKLLRPADARNPGGFSPAEYYRTRRILTLLYVPSPSNVQVVQRPRIWGLGRLTEFLRDTARKRLEARLPEEEKRLADAVVLGCRDEISQCEKDTLLETGSIHLMSVSGLHVGLLAAGVLFLLRLLPLPQRWKTGILLAIVLLYVMITGARPPAVRAGVLVTLTTLAFTINRQSSQRNALAFAAWWVLMLNPTSLFNTGTQLSFLAVGVLIHTPLFRLRKSHFDEDEQWEYWFVAPERRGRILRSMAKHYGLLFWNLLYASAVMTLILLPLVAWRFHVIALIGIVLNLLLWLPLTVAVMASAAVILIGWIPGVGWILGGICAGALWGLKWLIFQAAEVPYHCQWTAGPSGGWVIAFYAGVAVWMFLAPYLGRRRWLGGVLLVVVVLMMAIPQWSAKPRDFLRCSFLSVSHGLAVLVELPDGRNFLFDAGQFAAAEYPVRTISEYLWYRRVRQLDAIFISHPDLDHYNAIPGLLERFPTEAVYVTPQ